MSILDNHLSTLKNTDAYVLGDFNFDLIKRDETTETYSQMMSANGMQIINNSIVTRQISNTCLDHLYTNNIKYKVQMYQVSYDLFDHDLILTL